MANLLDYLAWRGDLLFSQAPFNPVDGLILSTFSYIHMDGIVPRGLDGAVSLAEAGKVFLSQPDRDQRLHSKEDLPLLEAMLRAPRFSGIRLCFCRSQKILADETQFAAIACLFDGTAFLAFRGTDASLVGWKEDFNMSFQDTVPAQLEALSYAESFAALFPGPLRLGGHSKGGNLAVFAGALCAPFIQERILGIYNYDGPGFREYLMGAPGYLRMVPKIATFVPQSSIIGMLMEHEEPYSVIRSSEVSIWQHDPYSWEVLGGGFIRMETVDNNSRLIDQAVKARFASMTHPERESIIDGVYTLLSSTGANSLSDLRQPQRLWSLVQAQDNSGWKALRGELWELIRAIVQAAVRDHKQEKLPAPRDNDHTE